MPSGSGRGFASPAYLFCASGSCPFRSSAITPARASCQCAGWGCPPHDVDDPSRLVEGFPDLSQRSSELSSSHLVVLERELCTRPIPKCPPPSPQDTAKGR